MNIHLLSSLPINILVYGDLRMAIGMAWTFGGMDKNTDSRLAQCITPRIQFYRMGEKRSLGCMSRRKVEKNKILGEYATMSDVLESRVLEGIPFRKVIEDEDTELMGQD